jgi:hypothetical protein
MSDSSYLAAVGLSDILSVSDEGGWAHEKLPVDDVVTAGFGAGARAEDAIDLLSPEEREKKEFSWAAAGLLDALREAEREMSQAAAVERAASSLAAAALEGAASPS